MRLIDADKFKEYLREQQAGIKADGNSDWYIDCLIEGVINGLNEMPTILQSEVVTMSRATYDHLLEQSGATEQIRWERDSAMEQLKANGLRFAHKDDYGWIPCSERVPEDRREVLVTAYWHETYQVMMATCFSDKEWWCVPFNNTGEHEMLLKPIAWMPLPEPYKEKT